ncbi:hypothetical protein [Burkholderia ubonensis]|uniref:hypothetical protein n=1 Tax=Burkholderia ubonensis TaxID=101571 RepID=UPI0007585503|nr:hypothetical protein [Burkholderia ubonensis]KUZ70337.1 hypothetical protein WI37_27535 [Burkholderia ubonensis]KVA22366.1 hypothetical protein WI42_09495 [Burkholderia ubonensis]KVA24011.1 hypothetical protein WI43_12320 [Burkholderia ubonensis]KVA39678.1 hypothetical protein WI46_16395 [Burkholderia ubonensis]KVC51504.1 hypothetical protein WI72_24235 [Burkholderia ubonensis]
MPFTTTQLAQAMHHNNLQTWADSAPENQAQYLANFQTHFNNVQNWIAQNGGPNPFGWDDVTGLHHNNGNQVVLVGPAQTAPFDDAFNQTRQYLGTQNFRLFQSAKAFQRLITVLIRLN